MEIALTSIVKESESWFTAVGVSAGFSPAVWMDCMVVQGAKHTWGFIGFNAYWDLPEDLVNFASFVKHDFVRYMRH